MTPEQHIDNIIALLNATDSLLQYYPIIWAIIIVRKIIYA